MEAHEVSELQENQEHASEFGLQRVSFTMSLLAVVLAMTTVMGHRTHTEAMLAQSRVSDEWNFYQAKKIRATDAKLAADIISTLQKPGDAAAQKIVDSQRTYAVKESSDLGVQQEKGREREHEVEIAEKRAGRFDLGEALLQMGVIITSITLLTRKQIYWYMGMLFGIGGVVAALLAFTVH